MKLNKYRYERKNLKAKIILSREAKTFRWVVKTIYKGKVEGNKNGLRVTVYNSYPEAVKAFRSSYGSNGKPPKQVKAVKKPLSQAEKLRRRREAYEKAKNAPKTISQMNLKERLEFLDKIRAIKASR